MAIVLTGFGPFGEHATNASWEAVRLVPELWGAALPPVRVEEIAVEYGAVQARPAAAWQEAIFTVHVGVSGRDKEVTLECRAHNSGYCRPDTGDCCPERGLCVEGGEEEADTCLDMAGLLEEVRAEAVGEEGGLQFQLSQDAGRYLCDFVYYRALHCSEGRGLFVHVPPLGQPYTAAQLARALVMVLRAIARAVAKQ